MGISLRQWFYKLQHIPEPTGGFINICTVGLAPVSDRNCQTHPRICISVSAYVILVLLGLGTTVCELRVKKQVDKKCFEGKKRRELMLTYSHSFNFSKFQNIFVFYFCEYLWSFCLSVLGLGERNITFSCLHPMQMILSYFCNRE